MIDLPFSRAYKAQCILFAVLLAALRECVELAASRIITCGLTRLLCYKLAALRDRSSVELSRQARRARTINSRQKKGELLLPPSSRLVYFANDFNSDLISRATGPRHVPALARKYRTTDIPLSAPYESLTPVKLFMASRYGRAYTLTFFQSESISFAISLNDLITFMIFPFRFGGITPPD